MIRNSIQGAALAAALVTGSASAQGSQSLGEVDFPVSCTEAGQKGVTQGVLLLHHMMYDQAETAFTAAAETDPACAMAHWGIAMTQFFPLWPGGQPDAKLAKGVAAMAAAADLSPGTDLEAAYLAAARAFYDKAAEPYRSRVAAWSKAQQAVHAAHPDDIDAAAFAALARLAMVPPTDQTLTVQKEVGALLEELVKEAPRHPGLHHYAIHAYDFTGLAERAIPFTEGYAKIAPENPHALHMPSHIYVRLGRWEDAAEYNRRSAQAVLDRPMADGGISNHYPHAVDYLAYSLLQIGTDAAVAEAEAEVRAMQEMAGLEDLFGSAHALAVAPARLALERDDWAAAATLEPPSHSAITWARYPQATAIRWFAKGIGAARAGRPEDAEAAIAELEGLHALMDERGMGYWVTLARTQADTIRAWLAFEAGDEEEAVAMLRAAADVEDGIAKPPVTPGHVLPARELLADMLRAANRVDEARRAYETVLTLAPGRRRSLGGLAALDGG